MIKFNFNADVNIKTNGNKVDKKGLKIILMVFDMFLKNGDLVYIKGKIENGQIVPFVKHMVN